MGFDLAVATPAFLDLTFVGLEALPAPGEERFAADLLRSPGGGAIIAVGAARLGLRTALAAPLGEDVAGEFVRSVLGEEGIALVERRARRMPTTVVMPIKGERAMVTVDPGVRASAADVAALEASAVAVSLGQLYCVPQGTAAYVTCGDDDARAFTGRPPAQLAGVRALFVNEHEACQLTSEATSEAAAERLASMAESVIVMRGAQGAFALSEGRRVEAPGMPDDADPPVDSTGAGDLLVAAYVWADQAGVGPEERLRWSVLYAGLSIASPTAVGGAVDEDRLLREGARHGLAAPRRARA